MRQLANLAKFGNPPLCLSSLPISAVGFGSSPAGDLQRSRVVNLSDSALSKNACIDQAKGQKKAALKN